MKITRRRFSGAGLPLAAAIAGLYAPAVEAQQDKPQYGGHWRVAFSLEPTSLDPIVGRSGGDPYYWHPLLCNVTHAAASKQVHDADTFISYDGRHNLRELSISLDQAKRPTAPGKSG